MYVKRFHESSHGLFQSKPEEVLVDVCLHAMMKEYKNIFGELVSPIFFQVDGSSSSHQQISMQDLEVQFNGQTQSQPQNPHDTKKEANSRDP